MYLFKYHMNYDLLQDFDIQTGNFF